MSHTIVSYAENRLPLTMNARAIDGPTPVYKPNSPLALKMARAADAAVTRSCGEPPVAGAPSRRCPCTLALIQSNGKLTSHANAPLTPPATGIETCVGRFCSNTVLPEHNPPSTHHPTQYVPAFHGAESKVPLVNE
jgi:hypothetical protein